MGTETPRGTTPTEDRSALGEEEGPDGPREGGPPRDEGTEGGDVEAQALGSAPTDFDTALALALVVGPGRGALEAGVRGEVVV